MTACRFRPGNTTVQFQPSREIGGFRSSDGARAFVLAGMERYGSVYVVGLLHDVGAPPEPTDDPEVVDAMVEAAVQHIMAGDLVLVQDEELPRVQDEPKAISLTDLIVDGPGGEEPIVVTEPARVEGVFVTEDGTPVLGVEVTVQLSDGTTHIVNTDGDGVFRLHDLDEHDECRLTSTSPLARIFPQQPPDRP